MDKRLTIHFLLAIIISLGFSACDTAVEESPCTENVETISFVGADTIWFSHVEDNRTKYFDCKSSNGLTDVVTYNRYEGYISQNLVANFINEDVPCHLYDYEYKLIDYSSTLYGYSFDFRIIQTDESLLMSIRDYNSSKFDLMYLNYKLSSQQEYEIIYLKGGKKVSDYTTQANVISEIEIDSVTYQDVLRITNTMIVAEGENSSITEYYIDKYIGLLRFKLKSGVYWDVKTEANN